MKKAIIILTAIVLAGCTCIGQIPPQTLYIDENCQATLPDYRNQVTTQDNCPGVTLQQSPAPGEILNATNPAVIVIITATDSWGNSTNVEFEVVATDTIYPTIIPSDTLLTHKIEDIGTMVKAAHLAMGRYMNYTYLHETPDSLKTLFADVPELFDSSGMILICPPGGIGDYTGTFWRGASYACPCDKTEAAEFVSINLPL